jgi:misacylated tRNA(Ala) deacylase
MPTDALCYRDAYLRSASGVTTRVEPADGHALVVLDRTVFYPGGGGQPADQGWLTAVDGTRWEVRTAHKDGPDIVHEVVIGPGGSLPAMGSSLTAEIDWARRHLLMRTHTALHALCGVVWRDHGALVTGGNMEPGRGRMDFEFETLSAELASAIEATVNAELAQERPVSVRFLTLEQAAATADLIRTRTNLLPAGITEVRVIDIEGLDLQADGGTHVANTREVGAIRVTGTESKGRINKRIRLELVDPDSIR